MQKSVKCLIGITAITFGLVSNPVIAAPLDVGSNTRVQIAPLSFKALRDQNLVRQTQDYSCGSAALATLLTFGLNDVVSEQEILSDLFSELSTTEATTREKDGFSLLDMKRVAQARSYKAQGFRINAQDLFKLSGPVIVFIKPQGYKHFAVLRGISGGRVFLADPSRGNVRMPMYQFLQSWQDDNGTGIIFVVERRTPQPQVTMNALTPPNDNWAPIEVLSARELLAVRAASAYPSNVTR